MLLGFAPLKAAVDVLDANASSVVQDIRDGPRCAERATEVGITIGFPQRLMWMRTKILVLSSDAAEKSEAEFKPVQYRSEPGSL